MSISAYGQETEGRGDWAVSKDRKTKALIARLQGRDLDARYLAFFNCFNRQHFFEAHEVLEELWLVERQGPNGAFYKGLIQLAGAFVHVQKHRPGAAAALFRLAQGNLRLYPGRHERLDVAGVLELIEGWLKRAGAPEFSAAELLGGCGPELSLEPGGSQRAAGQG